jgi:hypothetical protein
MGLELAKRDAGNLGVVGTSRGGIQEGGGLARNRRERLCLAPNAQTECEGLG